MINGAFIDDLAVEVLIFQVAVLVYQRVIDEENNHG